MNMETSIGKRIRDKMDKLARRLADLESDETVEKSLADVKHYQKYQRMKNQAFLRVLNLAVNGF